MIEQGGWARIAGTSGTHAGAIGARIAIMTLRTLLLLCVATAATPVAAQDAAAPTADAAPVVVAADLAAGEGLYKGNCRNCHGPSARGMASFPRLTGHDAAYLASRLEQYRSGEEVGPNSGLMWPIASEMSDADIADVSAYIATAFN